MPTHVGDTLKDAMGMSATEFGAYMLLQLYYWENDGLPTDDETLCRIAHVHPPQWGKFRSKLARFFGHPMTGGSWVHYDLDLKISKAAGISNKRKAAALHMHSKSSANVVQLHTHPTSYIPTKKKNIYNGGTRKSTNQGLPSDWTPKDTHYTLGVSLRLTHDDVSQLARNMKYWASANGRKKANWDDQFNIFINNEVEKRSKELKPVKYNDFPM